MVLQYRSKKLKGRWKHYNGKGKLEESVGNYEFRLLDEGKTRILSEGSYTKVLRRFRQIEFFKHRNP